MSQHVNITTQLHDSVVVKIPYSNITAIKSVQVLHNCNRAHNKVIKINCSLLENEENWGLIAHIFTNSHLDINEDIIYLNAYTDSIRFWLSDQNDIPVCLDENIIINVSLLID